MAQSHYITAVMADSPRAYYKLDEASGLPQDSSGNGLHMENTVAAPTYRQGGPFPDALAMDFERSDGDAFTRTTAPVSTATNNFAIEVWMKSEAFPGDEGRIITNGLDSNGWSLFQTSAGGNSYHMAYHGVADMGASSALVIDTWYHIAVVRRAGTTEYYLNGVLDATKGTSTPSSPTTSTSMGQAQDGSVRFDGMLAHVAFYETALTQARLEAHFDAATAEPEAPVVPSEATPPTDNLGRGAGW